MNEAPATISPFLLSLLLVLLQAIVRLITWARSWILLQSMSTTPSTVTAADRREFRVPARKNPKDGVRAADLPM
ncbi:hypothetical protein ACIODT_36745 [Streptomyces sp. NPDC088251]|uniref:hypothetical protein n=1 Tax=unclassified Streptomyces TaxID=2593676 RepID=UPI00380F3667